MSPLRRMAAIAVLAVCAACTRNGGGGPAPGQTSSASSSAPATAPPGTGVYEYQNAGLTATLDLDAGNGSLEIENDTGREIAPPGFYLLDARTGRRVPGTVEGAAPTPAGKTTDFDVRFSGLELRNIGLAILLIGHDNYGAFVPTATASVSG